MTVDLEFLIQKEGDFAWLPLESSTVEILVGRYQIIAQASEADCPIQVHIRHQYVQDGIWQEVVQQQLLRTDSQGRIEVLPSTFLHQGRWSISCLVDIEAQRSATDLDRHCIQLQVLEQEIDLDRDWEFLDALHQPLESHPQALQSANFLSPLQSADITSQTAWNNLHLDPPLTPLASCEESIFESINDISFLDEITQSEGDLSVEANLLDGALEQAPNILADTPIDHTDDIEQTAKPDKPAQHVQSALPQLPVLPKETPPIRLQISPGLILPPALFTPEAAADELPPPQLPVFPHLDRWETLSYQELSIALGRLYWSKLDTYGEAIDLDFESLELQERFLQSLQELAIQKARTKEYPSSSPKTEQSAADQGHTVTKALVPFNPDQKF
ncbi:hypothetical protein [Acaryochloris sp. IP29b_bin.148]|uniref:hypothetical protein n=1 Tax=Acaryochloris sp. IP29b_bin.148 TaxID=2969218 RepID=UPI0026264769|nr:hypothetical protein [Acaryochloris sp. IP29b_bin.148]